MCHSRIDPLGFAFEHFGALGEWRAEWNNGIPVDATGTMDDPAGDFDDAAEMIALVAQSQRMKRCYATRWYEYAIGRPSDALDRCAIDRLSTRFEATGGDIRDLLVDVAVTDAFLFRRVSGAAP